MLGTLWFFTLKLALVYWKMTLLLVLTQDRVWRIPNVFYKIPIYFIILSQVNMPRGLCWVVFKSYLSQNDPSQKVSKHHSQNDPIMGRIRLSAILNGTPEWVGGIPSIRCPKYLNEARVVTKSFHRCQQTVLALISALPPFQLESRNNNNNPPKPHFVTPSFHSGPS